MQIKYFLLIGCFLCTPAQAIPARLKKDLLTIYASHPFTFLYETPFNSKGKAQTTLCAECPPLDVNVQWTAIVPTKYYLNNQIYFKEKLCVDNKGMRFAGIRCCRLKDPHFKQFESDLHNLVPELPNLKKMLNKTINDPDNKLKGTIARMFLYMQLKYHFILPKSERIMYENWHRTYPPSAWERKRNQLIRGIQGDGNPYIG